MGPRNLLILFFSTVAVSLVILVIFFSLFFKNVDLNFNTKMPESAPDPMMGKIDIDPSSKSEDVSHATVNIPPEGAEPSYSGRNKVVDENGEEVPDVDQPPVSDDELLGNDTPPVPDEETAPPAPKPTPKPRSPYAAPPVPSAPSGPPVPGEAPSGPPTPDSPQ